MGFFCRMNAPSGTSLPCKRRAELLPLYMVLAVMERPSIERVGSRPLRAPAGRSAMRKWRRRCGLERPRHGDARVTACRLRDEDRLSGSWSW
jgi:hypothetical protein